MFTVALVPISTGEKETTFTARAALLKEVPVWHQCLQDWCY
jgi:hypothetical protein